MRELLIDSCTRILSQHAHSAARAEASGSMSAGLWEALCEGGFAQMPGSAEDGPSFADALAIIACTASYAARTPLAETLLSRYVLRRLGRDAGDDELMTVATLLPRDVIQVRKTAEGWRLQGRAVRVPWARHCRSVVVVAPSRDGPIAAKIDIDSSRLALGLNVAGEPRDDVIFDDGVVSDAGTSCLSPEEVQALGALIRTAQMTGSISRMLSLTLDYAQTRRQFGRPLAAFQSIKHLLARLAQNQAAAAAAFECAASEAERAPGSLSLPIAKIRAGEAATAAAAIAHQVFGAVGYTREHELQAHSRRVWSWRDEFGSEAQWSAHVGRQVCAAGGESLWRLVSGFGP